MQRKIGIIGGSGLDDPSLFEHPRDTEMTTPWGEPSSSLREGFIGGVPVVLMARHGRRHTIPPSQVNYRANLWALKEAGCTHGGRLPAGGNRTRRSGASRSVHRFHEIAQAELF